MHTALFEQALQRPDAHLFIDRLRAALEGEKAARNHFYAVIEENRKMEFINGEIYYHSPARLWHNQATGYLYQMLDAYVRQKKLGLVGIEKLLISLTRNDYEPDVCYWSNEKANAFQPRQAQFPALDFVAEVLSESTAEHDRNVKFQDYEAHGVGEYWLIDPEKESLEQYVLDGETYELRTKATDGMVESRAVPGFQIPIQAIFDEAENARVLTSLWQTP